MKYCGKERGSITLFLALILSLLLSLVCTSIESVRMASARTQILNSMDIGLYSVFGQYDRKLLEEYDLFALDGSMGGGQLNLAKICDNLESYMKPVLKQNSQKLELHQSGLTGYRLLTDECGEVFYQQIVQYMQETLGSQGVQLLLNKMSDRERKTEEADLKAKQAETGGSIDRYDSEMNQASQKSRQAAQEAENRQQQEGQISTQPAPTQPQADNPISIIKRIMKMGILELVLPPGREISTRTVSKDTMVSGRQLQQGMEMPDGVTADSSYTSGVAFIILRRREGLFQTVYENEMANVSIHELKEAMTIRVKGILHEEERAPHGRELRIRHIDILSTPAEPLPMAIDKWKLNTSLEAKLNYRPISLRNIQERSKFKIQEALTKAFRDYLYGQGFTEIHTPKIGARGAEGGANLFKFSYFHKPAVLAQSPQFYKQMMVGVFDRVFETGPVFRAEKHNTKRHLNEYTSLDFEMGYIDSFEEIMAMETGFLQYAMNLLKTEYAKEVQILKLEIPDVSKIPAVRFDVAKELVSQKYNRKIRNPFDLEPEEEALIGQYFKEEYGSDFVFVTHYPSKKRPFYAMDDPEDARFTLSFDLLFKGLEITTGGQRIHDYNMLVQKIEDRGMTQEGMEQYLDTFKHGMPPHGGLGIGLERLTMQLIGEENVRETCLFPREMNRLEP